MAGSGACMYHEWKFQDALGVQVIPIELPGTNSRMREPKPTCLKALAGQVVEGIAPLLALGQPPFALWGHSMGAWLAYEVAQHLCRPGSSLQRPIHLFASANRAPSLAALEHNPDSHVMHSLEAPEFWRVYTARYGANPELENKALRAYLFPGLKAEFALIETYSPSTLQSLPCGLTALGGKADPRYRPDQLMTWGALTSPEWFESHWFSGGHLFVRDQSAEVLEFLAGKLSLLLPSGTE